MMDELLTKKTENMDWETRTLCSDGNCIGVIDGDGRCNECGRPATGAADQGLPEVDDHRADVTPGDDASPEDRTPAPDHPEATGQESADPDWETRTLCSDGNCIGVIGRDGRCNECGKPGAEAAEGP